MTSEQEVADALYLPYLPEKSGWSWADLGMYGIHEYACKRGNGLNWSVSEDLMHPGLPLPVKTDPFAISPQVGPYIKAEASSSYLGDSLGSRYNDLPFSPEVPQLPITTRMPSELVAQNHLGSRGLIQPQPYRLKRETSSESEPKYGEFGGSTSRGRQPNSLSYLQPSEQWLPDRATSEGLMNPYSSRSNRGYSQAPLGSDTGDLIDSWPR